MYRDTYEGFSLQQLLTILWKGKWWIVGSFLIGITAAWLYLRYKIPLYRAQASMSIAFRTLFMGEKEEKALALADEAISNIEFFKSQVLLEKVIRQAQLSAQYYSVGKLGKYELWRKPWIKAIVKNPKQFPYYNRPIFIQCENPKQIAIQFPDKSEAIAVAIQNHYLQIPDSLGFSVYLNTDAISVYPITYKIVVHDSTYWIQYIKQHLQVTTAGGNVYNLFFIDTHPERAAEILNVVCEQYLEDELQVKKAVFEKRIAFLDTALNKVRLSLLRAEAKLELFESSRKLPVFEARKSVNISKLLELEDQLSQVELQLFELAMLKSALKATIGMPKDSLYPSRLSVFVAENIPPAIIKQLEQLDKALQRHFRLQNLHTPNSRQLRNVRQTIHWLKESLYRAIEQYEEALQNQQMQLKRSIYRIETEVLRSPEIERTFHAVKREYETNSKLYEDLLSLRFQAEMAMASLVSDSRIINRAQPPSQPIEPQRKVVWLSSFIGSIITGIFLAILREVLRKRIESKEDIERHVQNPIMGEIIRYRGKKEKEIATILPVLYSTRSAITESFRNLRINVEFLIAGKRQEGKGATILISSSVSGEGKSFISVNLAAAYSLLEKSVAIVDMDIRKPNLHTFLQQPAVPGITDYVAKKVAMEEIIYDTGIKNLYFVPAGTTVPHAAEIIASKEVFQLLERLKEQYDYIVIDSSPVGIVRDIAPIIPISDVFLYIVRLRYSHIRFLETLKKLQQDFHWGNVYLVLNDAKHLHSGYGDYGYRYYGRYYKAYRYYVSEDGKEPFHKRLWHWITHR